MVKGERRWVGYPKHTERRVSKDLQMNGMWAVNSDNDMVDKRFGSRLYNSRLYVKDLPENRMGSR